MLVTAKWYDQIKICSSTGALSTPLSVADQYLQGMPAWLEEGYTIVCIVDANNRFVVYVYRLGQGNSKN